MLDTYARSLYGFHASETSATNLDVEVARLSATTRPLELAALGADKRLLVFVRTEAEVLHGFTSVLRTTDQNGVAAGRGSHRKLVKGERFAASSLNTSAGSIGETQSSNAQLRQFQKAVVISDGAHHNDRFGVLATALSHAALVARKVHHTRHRDRWAVDLRHKQATKNRLVESRVSTASQEAIQLYKQKQVWVLALGGRTLALLNMVLLDINTLSS